jgi:hypothetical protein
VNRALGILLLVATLWAQALVAGPAPLGAAHAQKCQCCDCGGTGCCVTPATPTPAAPAPVTGPVSPAHTLLAVPPAGWDWQLPRLTAPTGAFPGFDFLSCRAPLLERLCCWLI